MRLSEIKRLDIPLIYNGRSILIAILIQGLAEEIHIVPERIHCVKIHMPRQEIQWNLPLRHCSDEFLCSRLATDQSWSTDLKFRKQTFKMPIGSLIKIIELLRSSCPASAWCRCIILIPDLPILYIVMESICPSFIIVTDDVLAYLCPLLEILRRMDIMNIRRILDCLTKTIIHL